MGTQWDQTYVSMAFSTRLVVCTDDTKTSVFSGSTRVWLKGGGMETSNSSKVMLKFLIESCEQHSSGKEGLEPTLMTV